MRVRYLVVVVALVVGVSAAFAADERIRIDLKKALGPNNQYTDAEAGVSVRLPEGWGVKDATRWGEGHREATVVLKPKGPAGGTSALYYKFYTREEVEAIRSGGGRAMLLEQAQLKETERQGYLADYRNEPASYQFFEAGGRPAMAYTAVFRLGERGMTEHFIRVLGKRGVCDVFHERGFRRGAGADPAAHAGGGDGGGTVKAARWAGDCRLWALGCASEGREDFSREDCLPLNGLHVREKTPFSS